jgi:hypothetical protein
MEQPELLAEDIRKFVMELNTTKLKTLSVVVA